MPVRSMSYLIILVDNNIQILVEATFIFIYTTSYKLCMNTRKQTVVLINITTIVLYCIVLYCIYSMVWYCKHNIKTTKERAGRTHHCERDVKEKKIVSQSEWEINKWRNGGVEISNKHKQEPKRTIVPGDSRCTCQTHPREYQDF